MNQVVGYVRVSSRAQDHAMQKHAIERAASARGDTIGEVYSEKRKSDTLERPELSRLRADSKAGKIGKVYVYRLDRLSRSGIRDTIDVVQEFRRHGTTIVTVADGFNVDGPEAELVMCVLAWAAEGERRTINERISASREQMEAQGRSWGRPSRMTVELVAKACALHGKGKSLRQIAVALKIPKDTIARALKKERHPSAEVLRAFLPVLPVAKTSPQKRGTTKQK
jgi:DNA invertase Pin-like site-specific DNA recombinase